MYIGVLYIPFYSLDQNEGQGLKWKIIQNSYWKKEPKEKHFR